MEIYELTVHELLEKLEKKELTSQEIVESYLKRIDEKEDDVQAFVTKAGEKALEKAKEIDKKRENGEKISKFAGKIICVQKVRKLHVVQKC